MLYGQEEQRFSSHIGHIDNDLDQSFSRGGVSEPTIFFLYIMKSQSYSKKIKTLAHFL